jgi:hypothetical protein
MKYTVTAFKMIDTAAGMIEDMSPAAQETVGTQDKAQEIAISMAKSEKYSSVYVHYVHRDSDCYLNPVVGFEPTGKDWVSHYTQ